jgi:hypothetical protein
MTTQTYYALKDQRGNTITFDTDIKALGRVIDEHPEFRGKTNINKKTVSSKFSLNDKVYLLSPASVGCYGYIKGVCFDGTLNVFFPESRTYGNGWKDSDFTSRTI